jgi:replicative DNA helicase
MSTTTATRRDRETEAPHIEMPPTNFDAENSLLGSLLLDSTEVDNVSGIVTEASFYQPRAGRVFRVLSSMVEKSKYVDTVTVFEALRKLKDAEPGDEGFNAEQEFLIQCMNTVPIAGHAVAYAEMVADCHVRRRLLRAAVDMKAMARRENIDVDEALADSESALHTIIEERAGRQRVDVTIRESMLQLLDALHDGPIVGWPTGFTDFDDLTGGGLKAGQLVILAARPSMGKTALAANMMLGLAKRGSPVLMFSMEQSRLELSSRLLQTQTGIGGILTGERKSADEMARILESASGLGDLPIQIDENTVRFSAIASLCRVAARKHGVRVVFLDYLQLIQPDDRRIPREQQVAEITRGLKQLARQLKIAVVALAQLNRGIEGRDEKRPRLSDLRESGSIEQDADIVLFPNRPHYYDPQLPESDAVLIVAKHRNGKTGAIDLHWDARLMTFRNAADCPPGMAGEQSRLW